MYVDMIVFLTGKRDVSAPDSVAHLWGIRCAGCTSAGSH